MIVSQRKEFVGYNDNTKEVHWSDGTKSVFTDKNGTPIVPAKFVNKMEMKRNEEWEKERQIQRAITQDEIDVSLSKAPKPNDPNFDPPF